MQGYSGAALRPRASITRPPAQQPARLSIDEVRPGAGFADDDLVFGLWHVRVSVRPKLDFHPRRRAGENDVRHHSLMAAL